MDKIGEFIQYFQQTICSLARMYPTFILPIQTFVS